MHRSMIADACAYVKKPFINHWQLPVHVVSYLTRITDMNLHNNCRNSVMVEQGLNIEMHHQAWLYVRRIGQQRTQCTPHLVYLTMIDLLIENTD